MRQAQATILYNDNIGPSYFKMGLKWSGEPANPGQFVMVQVGNGNEVLLRRPFSVSAILRSKGVSVGIELLYKVVGRGTKLLSCYRKNDHLDILGPLGQGFYLNNFSGPHFFVAGGIGVAPIRFLAEHLAELGKDLKSCQVFLGGRSQEDLLCQKDFMRLGMPVILTTDDGSAGDQCLVTHPMESALKQSKPEGIFACGPGPMLSCVAGIVQKYQVPCQVSIETMMACGMGACLGCAAESAIDPNRYLHACLDGPVFDINQIKL
jgi:dihydroorotate dehydrogenase electron transfer subunit